MSGPRRLGSETALVVEGAPRRGRDCRLVGDTWAISRFSPAPAPPKPKRRRWAPLWHWAAHILLPTENPGAVVYGAILVGALLAAESGHPETYGEAIASGLTVAAVFWLLHAYASALGRRVARHERLTAGVLVRSLGHEWSIMPGAAIPLLTLVLTGIAGGSLDTAVNVAVWTSVAIIVVFEIGAGITAGARGTELVLDALVGAVLGAAILALKAMLG